MFFFSDSNYEFKKSARGFTIIDDDDDEWNLVEIAKKKLNLRPANVKTVDTLS